MSATLRTQEKILPVRSPFTSVQAGILQRKCACGGSPSLAGDCEECRNKQLTLQRYSANRPEPFKLVRSLAEPSNPSIRATVAGGFGHNFGQVQVHPHARYGIQTKLAVSQPGDRYEQEADRVAEQLTGTTLPPVSEEQQAAHLSGAQPRVQRTPANGADASPEVAPTPAPSVPEPASPEATPRAGLIVEDEASALGPGQMRKSEFLDAVQHAVCAAADAELAAVGRSTEGCPYIDMWMAYYRTRESQQVERTVRRYAPETVGVATARDYIPQISARVRRAVAVWAKTGEIIGVPEGVSPEGSDAGIETGAAGTPSATGNVQLKERERGISRADHPQAIQAQLGAGGALDTGLKSRMESAFGYDFSRVRVHTDAQAAALSASLHARAFTIGRDVAFAAGEYQPGTLIGEALLAHELAHVVQQGGAAASPLLEDETESTALEEEADWSALGAVASLWGRAPGALANIAHHAMPRLRSGLRLSRCGCSKDPKITKTLDIFELAGRSQDPHTAVRGASQIWEDGAGITFSATFHPPISEEETRRLIGTEPGEDTKPVNQLYLDYPTDDQTPEIDNLRSLKHSAGKGELAAFFIPHLGYLAPSAVDPSRFNPIVYIGHKKCSPGFDLAHELAHILLGFGHSTKWDSPLMAPENCSTGITGLECRIARGDPEARREHSRQRSKR